MAYLQRKRDRRQHERRRRRGGGGRRVDDVANQDTAWGGAGELHLDDPGAPMYCPWCGLPILYVGSADHSNDDPNPVHVYDCITDGHLYLMPGSGFSRRRPPGWIQP